jgi:hypothetical protein
MLGADALKSPPQIAPNTSVYAAATSSTQRAALPTLANGDAARYVMVTATGGVYFDTGDVGVTFSSNDSMILPTNRPMIMNVAGKTHFSFKRFATPNKNLGVSPLENQ